MMGVIQKVMGPHNVRLNDINVPGYAGEGGSGGMQQVDMSMKPAYKMPCGHY